MTAIVAATGGAGMLASALLHQAGMTRLWLRYGMSVAFAYLAFMFFLWLWIVVKRRTPVAASRDRRDDFPDGDAVDVLRWSDGSSGHSGTTDPPSPATGQSHWFDFLGIEDETIVVVVLLAAIMTAIGASLYVVIIAPELLAEVLLDGVLATVIYRRLRAGERRYWADSALSRTWVPVLVVAIFFVIAGAACQWYAPEATTLAEVFRHHRPAP